MRTIGGRWKGDRRRPEGLRPGFDRLEGRLALSTSSSTLAVGSSVLDTLSGPPSGPSSGPSLAVVATDPGSPSTLDGSPTALTVRFGAPLDAFSVGKADFQLVHVESDGTTRPLGIGEPKLLEALDPSDPTGRQIVLTLTAPLAGGHYRLIALGNGQLQSAAGSPLATSGQDAVISDFTIDLPRSGLSSAIDLGTPSSTDTVRAGFLNLSTDPWSVDYYKVTLAPGHHWRLGLEALALDGPGKLDTSLSLFDAGGDLIATGDQGPVDDPGDPYLFAGLAPGVYYVGVSAKGNVPDPTGDSGQGQTVDAPTAQFQPGGPFQLHVVADVADQPTRVLGLGVDHADPLSNSPTGLTLQFDGSIQLAALTSASQPAVTLVDQQGRDWPLTPSRYNASQGRLSFGLDRALPAGRYTLELGAPGGLIDLAGMAPVAPGLPARVLGTFNVAPTISTPGDLGPILRDSAISGLGANLSVGPRSALSEQFTVVVPGIYSLRGVGAVPGVTFTLADARSDILANGADAKSDGSADLYLAGGSYRLTLTNGGDSAAGVPITIQGRGIEYSQLLDGGVGQGSAFSLRLVNPGMGPSADSAPSSTPSVGAPTTPGGSTTVASPSTGMARGVASNANPSLGMATPVGPYSAFLVSGPGPVGRPSAPFNQVNAVGPSGPSGAVALASMGAGLPPGLTTIPEAISPGGDLSSDARLIGPEIPIEVVAPLQKQSTLESGLLSRSPGSRKEDEVWLARAEWFGQIAATASAWFGRSEVVAPDVPAAAPEAVAVAAGSPGVEEETTVETASVASPIGFGVLVAVALRYGRRRMGEAGKPSKAKSEGKKRTILAGPHHRIGKTARR